VNVSKDLSRAWCVSRDYAGRIWDGGQLRVDIFAFLVEIDFGDYI
jgi:hypothetical protein